MTGFSACQKCGLNFDDGSLLSLHQCLDAADSEHLKIPSEKDSDFLQLQQKVAVASQKVYLLLQDSTTEEKGGLSYSDMGKQDSTFPSGMEKCVCPICKKEFALPGELKEHFRGHHSGPQLAFTCGEGGCSFTTEERKQFHSHLKHAHEVTPVPCPHHFCSLLFSSRQEMELHCRNHSPFHCSHCNFVSSNVKLFWQHRKRHAKPLEGRGILDEENHGSKQTSKDNPSVPALDELIQEESMEEEEEGPCHKCKRPLRDDGVGESESSKGDDGIGETVKNNPPGQRRFKGDVEEGTEHLFRTHMCPECKRCFKKRTHLVEHLHLHFPDPSLQCPNCQKYFTSKSKLKIHLMREMGQKAHRCPLCDYSSVEKNALNRHMASMHENIDNFYSDVYACPVCEETFRLSQALKEHLKSHKVEQRTLACFREGCSYATEDRKEFSRHLKDTHGQKAVECKYHACALLFSSREEMETHRKSHYAFHCDQCDFVCSNKHVFRRHKRQGHPGSQELRCDFCPYRSFNPVEYNDHVGKMHASEKIHKCAECPFATAHKRVLIRHMLLHTGEKPHKCDQCDFTCRDVSYLSKHMLTHSDDKNYMCTECGYVTKWKHYLNVHMRKHTGDLRYQCNQCSYRCHRADQLSSHKLRHQGKSLICEVCGFACKRKYELQKHMQAKHSEDYQIPMFQCQYCSYQTKYKQALLNHENCKHTKQKEFRCALCPYKTFSNTSLFFHKRKVHGYIPGDKEWLDNYAKEEMASNSLDLLVGFGYGGSALRSDPPLGQKKRTSPLESQEEIYQRAFGASLFGHCSTQPSDNREEETNTEHKQTLLKENDHVSASAMTESGRNDGLEKSIQHSVESHTVELDEGFGAQVGLCNSSSEELAKESAGSQLENIEPWSCQETDVMCSVARPESSLVTENTGTVIQDPNGLEHRDDVDGNSDCNMAEIGMDVEESSESGSSSPECSASQETGSKPAEGGRSDQSNIGESWSSVIKPNVVVGGQSLVATSGSVQHMHPTVLDGTEEVEADDFSQSELVLKALRKQDKEQAETLVLEGRVQMLVVQSEARIFKCERCSYVTRKEKSMILHSKSSCQNRKGSLACKECGACFKQQRGLNTHLLKKCPVLLKRNKLLLRPTPTAHPKHTCDRSGQPQPEDTAICEDKTTERANLEGEGRTCEENATEQAQAEAEVLAEDDGSFEEGANNSRPELSPQAEGQCNEEKSWGAKVQTSQELLDDKILVVESSVSEESDARELQVDEADGLGETEVTSNPLKLADKYRFHQEKFHCNFCSFTCSRKSTIASHVKEGCKKVHQFKCIPCSMYFKSKRALKNHQTVKHCVEEMERLRTETAEVIEYDEEDTQTEYDTAATEEDDEWLKSAEEMEEGCSTSEMDEDCREKRLSCLSCPFTCYRERAMATHKKRGCMKPGEFQCTLCSFICKSAKAMNQHRKHHRKCYVKRPQLKCKLCGFTCKQLRCLNQHVSIKHEGVKPYQCIFCEFSTARRYRLEAHESLHTGVGRITCEVCGQTFGTNSKLRIHRLRVHEKKPTHFCTLCDYSGYNQNDITRHTNSCHNGDLKHLCQQCGAGFSSEMALKHHSLRKHEEKVCYSCPHCVFSCFSEATLKCHVQRQHPHLECGICKEAFESREELEEHRRIHFHQRCEYCSFAAKERQQLVQHLLDIHEGSLEAEGKQFKCSFCGFSCCHQLVFDYHMKAHGGTRMYKCTDCDYTTKNKQKITWHIRIHTGEKPYKCNTCSYACADPSRLKYHMRIHQDERKYLCPDCGYKCKWVNQLKYHMTKHTGLKPYRCDECEYCTNRADALRIHKETRHSDTRSFICEQCGKAFKTRFLLKTHLKKHSEEKPYVCNVCFRGFRWAAGLRHHYLTHTNEHPFFCRHCSYKAKQKFQVIKHILRHHPQLVTEDPNDGVGKDPAAPVVHLLHAKLDSLAGVPATLLVPKAATETEVVPQDLQQS
ncbi:zinc finger protein 142 isoform X2 [Latimeria chalumnae]|nr:PREDICTED: zinc finger protein 142 isoform X2 [Latimeria chalumnae]|eukprot:XP_005991822.1 PREDICTED: zinc finger protein 142 isoform X2 [Latimeria chalumnae]